MLSSLSFPSFLPILIIIIVTVFIGWSSVAFFSEGQKETASIKITLPTNGQNISTGSNLTISGIATGTNSTSHSAGNNKDGNHCYVSVIVNNIKPYQADGPKGVNDYSKWYYALLTNSAAIKEGQNKLTGRLSCLPEGNSNTNSNNVSDTPNNMIKWDSINVTGVSTPTSSTVIRNNHTITNSNIDKPQQSQGNTTITSNSTAISSAPPSNSTSNSTSQNLKKENNSNKIATSRSSLPAKLTQSPFTSMSTPNNNYDNNNNAKPLSISIQSSQYLVNVNGRGTSTITAMAYDAATGKKINNAIVKLKIAFTSNGTSKEIVGHSGEVTYSTDIKPNSKNSSNINLRTTALGSAPGYISTSKTSSSSTSTSTMTSKSNQSIISNNGSDNLTQNILKNVQRELKQKGIDIALGK